MTANGLCLKIGTAPSQTAQAEHTTLPVRLFAFEPKALLLALVVIMVVSTVSGSPS